MSTIPWISQDYKETTTFIKNLQACCLFSLAASSAVCYVYYQYSLYYYGENDWGGKPFDVIYKWVGLYAVADLYLCTSIETVLHHLFILSIIFYGNYLPLTIEHRFMIAYPLLKTEITTLFYVMKDRLPNHTLLRAINGALLYGTFLKFRVYDFYNELLYKSHLFDFIFSTYSYELSYVLRLSCYGLYTLNLYWTLILTKIIYKGVASGFAINKDKIAHWLCRFIYTMPSIMVLSVYHLDFKPRYLFDVLGNWLFGLSAYMYHEDLYQTLLDQPDDLVGHKNENNVYCILFNVAIQLRSLLTIVTHSYNSPFLFVVLTLSGMAHLGSIYLCMWHVAYRSDLQQDELKFLKNNRVLLSIPFMQDGLYIIMHSTNEHAVPLILVYILFILLHVVNPFYKLTTVSFGLTVLAQSYYLAKSIQTY